MSSKQADELGELEPYSLRAFEALWRAAGGKPPAAESLSLDKGPGDDREETPGRDNADIGER